MDQESDCISQKRRKVSHPLSPSDTTSTANNTDSTTSAPAVTHVTVANHDDHQNSHTVLVWNKVIPVDIRMEIYAMVDIEIQTRVVWHEKTEYLETETIQPQNILERRLFTAALIKDMEALQTLLPSLSLQCQNFLSERIHLSIATLLVRSGHIGTLQWFCKEQNLHLTPILCESAVFGGNRRIIQWLHQQDSLKYSWRNVKICLNAVYSGQLDLFKWLHEHGCSWSDITCQVAARLGCLEILQYAHEHGCPWNEGICKEAAIHGHLEVLKYAHEQGCPWDWRTCSEAAYHGYLDILKYAHEQGCPWYANTCSSAATGGHLDILKYAHEQGCPWDDTTFQGAFMSNKLELVQYAYEHGCPWNEELYRAPWNGRRTIPHWARKYFREQKKKQSRGQQRFYH